MTRLASLLLVLLMTTPVYAQSTVQVIDNRYDSSDYPAMRTSFEVSVRYASAAGLTNLGTLLELVNAQPNLTRAELNGNGDQARLSVRFSFATSDELNAFVERAETTEMLDRIRAINPETFAYELDIRKRQPSGTTQRFNR